MQGNHGSDRTKSREIHGPQAPRHRGEKRGRSKRDDDETRVEVHGHDIEAHVEAFNHTMLHEHDTIEDHQGLAW